MPRTGPGPCPEGIYYLKTIHRLWTCWWQGFFLTSPMGLREGRFSRLGDKCVLKDSMLALTANWAFYYICLMDNHR
jgi:hypothetical protein